jgi:hypothetical protein
MSLNWNISDIKNYKEICWKENPDDPENNILNPITESLIFTTIGIGLNEITEDNVYDFYLRSIVSSEVYGKPIVIYEEDSFHKRNYTFEEVKQHIGLKTNATNFTNSEFMKKMLKSAAKYIN